MPTPSSKRRQTRASGNQARAILRPAELSSKAPAPVDATGKPRVALSVVVFNPQREYAFIREDLRRLLLTASVLIVVMVALLLVIDH